MHPILVRIPLPGWKFFGEMTSIPIHSYGVMLGLSLVVGWYMSLGLAEKDGLPKEALANCYVFTALSAVVMSRVLYYVTNPDEFKSFVEIFALWRGGLVAYGGFLGGFLGSVIYMRRQRLPLWPWADVCAPPLAAGLMLTRVGCYLFGCDFGKPLGDGAPALLKKLGTFPHWAEGTLPHGSGSPAWVQHVQHRGLDFSSTASFPVHPTQIYESLIGAAMVGLLFLVRKNVKFRGQVFLTFTFVYGVLRFLLEMLRDDLERGEFGPHIAEQWMISGGLFIFALAYIVGIAPSIADPTMRRMTQAIALVPAVVAFLLLKPPSFGDQTLIQLSTSQWVALLTAIPAAAAYAVYFKAAEAHPESALAIHLEDFYKEHPEARPKATDESAKGADVSEDAEPPGGDKTESAADDDKGGSAGSVSDVPSEATKEPV
ncbi:MAG TPA: prolipoprotein diacylglyceryl transferase family protein [Polyangiaceae bacterium]|nr:prolipoprotein diacylglyceryl transferase family protein [Polyangiaceae bacterium]